MTLDIRKFPSTRVAYVRHTGPYGSAAITQMWQKFGAWCSSAGLMTPRRRMYGISQDNPNITPPEKCRYDACIEIDNNFMPSGARVQTIRGGQCACAKFIGSAADIYEAWRGFITEVLEDSSYQMDDRPNLELYETDYTVDEATGVFTCVLCVPVRSA